MKGGAAQVNLEGRPVQSAHCSYIYQYCEVFVIFFYSFGFETTGVDKIEELIAVKPQRYRGLARRVASLILQQWVRWASLFFNGGFFFPVRCAPC